jgi:hypothetical protein
VVLLCIDSGTSNTVAIMAKLVPQIAAVLAVAGLAAQAVAARR